MVNSRLDKYGTPAGLTITLGSLASSTAGVGRQSTIVDNTSARYTDILLAVSIKLGTSPTGNRSVQIYLIRDNNAGSPIRDDNAGASDAAITVLNAALIGVLTDTTGSGDILTATFLISKPGPKWGVAVVHDTGVNLNSTNGNHILSYVGINPEIQ